MKLKIEILFIAIISFIIMPNVWASDTANLSYETLMTQGNKLWGEGKIEEARKSFEKAVIANPRAIDAHMKLGGLLLSDHNYTAAIDVYQQTISLDKKNVKAWMGLGISYLHAGKRELAQAAFDEAIQIDPSRKAQLAGLAEKTANNEVK